MTIKGTECPKTTVNSWKTGERLEFLGVQISTKKPCRFIEGNWFGHMVCKHNASFVNHSYKNYFTN